MGFDKKKDSLIIYNSDSINYDDLYIKYIDHPEYSSTILFTKSQLQQIITKLEVLLFTNKGDVSTDPNFGCDLERYIYDFFVDVDDIEAKIQQQITSYIPEMEGIYEMAVEVFEADTEQNPSQQNIIYIYFAVNSSLEFIFQI